jgi:hypothetical protein
VAFSEWCPPVKEYPSFDAIIIVYSIHVEAVTVMEQKRLGGL